MNGGEMKGRIYEENKLFKKRDYLFKQALKQEQAMQDELKKPKQSESKVI